SIKMPARSFRLLLVENRVRVTCHELATAAFLGFSMADTNLPHLLRQTGMSAPLTAMTDRARATEILREGRTILAQRLLEKVIEQGEELLDDARGDSYMNEIESLYEQVGLKLSHVSQMLSNLPAEDVAPQTHTAAAQHGVDRTFTVATEPAP